MARLARSRISILRTVAGGATAFAACGTAFAADAPITPVDAAISSTRVELIGGSRLGCGEGAALWTVTTGGTQCAFDTASRGARMSATENFDRGTIEVYATYAKTTTGAHTPDQLLTARQHRRNDSSEFFLVGLKGSAFDNRLKFTGEFARTKRLVEHLLARHWNLAGDDADSGASTAIRVDAMLADRPGLNWSLTAEYRSVNDDYSVGRSPDLFRYYGSPGTRMALSSAVRVGDVRLNARVEQTATPFGALSSRKAGIDLDGVSLRLISRKSRARPILGSTLQSSRTSSESAYLDLDPNLLAASLLPELPELPFVIPTSISLSYRRGETKNDFGTSEERFRRTSFGLDGMWESPIGETSLSFWRDRREGVTAGTGSRLSETFQIDHGIRWGRWRFSADASLSRDSGDGPNAYGERSWSFGQSIAYSAPNGPEFRLQLGQDRGAMRMLDDSFISADRYSRITASLDLSRYLQTRFERSDLKLTVDYRKTIDRTDGEFMLGEEIIDRWIDADRREGLLISFGMKL